MNSWPRDGCMLELHQNQNDMVQRLCLFFNDDPAYERGSSKA